MNRNVGVQVKGVQYKKHTIGYGTYCGDVALFVEALKDGTGRYDTIPPIADIKIMSIPDEVLNTIDPGSRELVFIPVDGHKYMGKSAAPLIAELLNMVEAAGRVPTNEIRARVHVIRLMGSILEKMAKDSGIPYNASLVNYGAVLAAVCDADKVTYNAHIDPSNLRAKSDSQMGLILPAALYTQTDTVDSFETLAIHFLRSSPGSILNLVKGMI